MQESNTSELLSVLKNAHSSDFPKYIADNKASLLAPSNDFYAYIRDILRTKKITQKELFLRADISDGYGYKLLSGEKKTRQRDSILRICYVAEMNLEETQRALNKYEMAQLYPKNPRDAFLILKFNEQNRSIFQLNQALASNHLEELKAVSNNEDN